MRMAGMTALCAVSLFAASRFRNTNLAVKAIRTAVVKCRLPIFTAGNFCCLIDLRRIYEF